MSLELHELTDSRAVVALPLPAGSSPVLPECALYGPRCATARTLPFTTPAVLAADGRGVEFHVAEPCYWSPHLPFLYDVRLTLRCEDNATRQVARSVGLRRLEAHRRSFRLQGERIVLRGARSARPDAAALAEARVAECALVVSHPEQDAYSAASAAGVLLAVDSRAHAGDVPSLLRELSWSAAVGLVLLGVEQLAAIPDDSARRLHLLLAQVMTADAAEAHVAPNADAIAVELAPGERPPAWMARAAKPVIAIRRGAVYANLHAARAACDSLQAELAPEFDLAGYFVD